MVRFEVKERQLGFYISYYKYFSYPAIKSSMSLSGQCRPSSEADFRCFDGVLALLIIIAGSGNCKCLHREKERGDFCSNSLILARMASLHLDLKSSSILGVTALLLFKSSSASVPILTFDSLNNSSLFSRSTSVTSFTYWLGRCQYNVTG